MCEHKWCYQGTVYWADEWPLPGSGARARYYGDKYFCERCLETKVTNARTEGNTYCKPIVGTLPR